MFDPSKFRELIQEVPPAVKPKADPFSLDALIEWLEKQPGDETYCWLNTGECLFGRYGRHLGLGNRERATYMAVIYGFGDTRFGQPCEPFDGLAMKAPHTFGAALSRALALRGAP